MAGPSISIVTASFNGAPGIERALRSVLSAMGPDDEYIVVDGGSTDGTTEIIRKYAHRLSWWVSEPDAGQSHALNKGFARAGRPILGWLNADDVLLPGALDRVRQRFERKSLDVLCGSCRYEYADGRRETRRVIPRELRQLDLYDPIHQPSCFWRREWHERVGGLREDLHYGMDWDLWIRLARTGARFSITDELLSVYCVTGVNKSSTGGERRNREMYRILREQHDPEGRILVELAYRLLWPLKRLRSADPGWLWTPLSDLSRSTLLATLGPFYGFDRVRRVTHAFC
jgi:glycosyltransferase involved in cell wall biosynthesis